jgi:hypothetical protein
LLSWALLSPLIRRSLAPVRQAWLSVSNEPAAMVTGQYFYHQKRRRVHPAAQRADLLDVF